MSQDLISDALNRIMNAKKAGKSDIVITRHSKLLRNILDIAKEEGYIDYTLTGKELKIDIKRVNTIKAIKPRYTVPVKGMNSYVRRFLPAKDFGFIIVSTSKGLMKHKEAEEKNIGGCLIAYMY
ncbi:30S ribosomal protein S8 [Candidatus Pacearchaeota archaeon]|nr:30S ribosomal protein S8 [Candidatus Pacearchaeota archaeon]